MREHRMARFLGFQDAFGRGAERIKRRMARQWAHVALGRLS
ncbi:hypothetical protein [Sorangium cellulosum]|uniref:Uncharacterized protein n=1 Tax=Sorangium cellulosum So0157-2 TaxID=1254432 RepID=S4Y7W8_SORCE|nr:hypothetical protein [Sorangium cellulosum]AGP41542.1 hypothetical protein SCE1572_47875 [Sorangium cellulosum So0157-2]